MRLRQLDGEGPVWKEPPGPEVPDLEGSEFEDVMMLDLGDGGAAVADLLEHLNIPHPWDESEFDVRRVQKLATLLKPLDWEAVQKKGGEAGDNGEVWERFRAFVVDAARSCNAIEFELDD